jgi:hypothetical protein
VSLPNKEGPGLASPDLRKRIATTTFQNQIISGGKDTAQASLEDYRQELAERARATGMQAAESPDLAWCRQVSDWIYDLPPGFHFTADDIRRDQGSSKASGPVIGNAARRRVIVHVGWVKSTAVSRHGADIKQWRRT